MKKEEIIEFKAIETTEHVSLKIDLSTVITGSRFKAYIDGHACEGRIYNEGTEHIYLCQNNRDGAYSNERLGFRFSWAINYKYNTVNLIRDMADVTDLFISPPEIGYKITPPLKAGDYTVSIENGCIKVGCQTITNEEVIEIYKNLIK